MARCWRPWLTALAVGLTLSAAQAQVPVPSAWPASQALPATLFRDLDGRTIRLSDLRGRAVLINFWATWCEPCRAEMPTLQQVADLYGPEKLAVLAVNVKDSDAKVRQFMTSTAMNLPVLPDPEGSIARQWQVRIFPTTVLIGADGRARWRIVGEMDWTGPEAERLLTGLFVPQRR
jgi:thiol-disulfide isomerase/thioredoxin